MSKHTPGPWILDASDGETTVINPEDEYVAFISTGEFPDDPDGLLIAAAPNLVEALKELKYVLVNFYMPVVRGERDSVLDAEETLRLYRAMELTDEALQKSGVDDV